MSDTQEKKLDTMLQSRRVEPASANLAEQIILKAQETVQVPTMTLAQWVKRLFGEFHLPQPAYVLAFTLVLGVVIGFSVPSDTTTPDDGDVVYVQSFLSADESLL
ncbi:MAG TPA: hypothetical protein VFM35_10505 [Candidatus Binatia bacterium]|nr:hypothetical protein [Candidatus Binatia bacterium]